MTDSAPELVERIARGDRQAAEALVRRLRPLVTWSIRRSLGRRLAAQSALEVEDLEQEVWLSLFKDGARQLRAYQPARSSLERYVHLICRREVANSLRLRRRRQALHTPAEGEPTVEIESRVQARNSLSLVLAHLEAQLPKRALFILRQLFGESQSAPEVSQRLGVSTQVVYNWQHKIRRLARDFRVAQRLSERGLGAGS